MQVGSWGGDDSNTCLGHHQIEGGAYGNPGWGQGGGTDNCHTWLLCCNVGRPPVPFSCARDLTALNAGNSNALSSWLSGSEGYAPVNAFDGDLGTLWENQNGGDPDVLAYDFGSSQIVEAYSIQGYAPWCHDSPQAWTFEGSDDASGDSSWVLLDTQSGVPQRCDVSTDVTLTAPASYRFYRFHVTEAGTAGGNPASIAEAHLCLL